MRAWILPLLLALGCSQQPNVVGYRTVFIPSNGPMVEATLVPIYETPIPPASPTIAPAVPFPFRLSWEGKPYPEHESASRNAANNWNWALMEEIFSFVEGPGPKVRLDMMNYEEGKASDRKSRAIGLAISYTRKDFHRVRIYIGLNEPQLTEVVTHEYGHLLGLDHSVNVEDVMYKSSTPDQGKKLTPHDIRLGKAEVARRRAEYQKR